MHHKTSLVPVSRGQDTSTFFFDGKPIRVGGTPDMPMFAAEDLCGVLKLGKYRAALSKLDEDERGSLEVDTLGGRQLAAAVTEGGMFTLILRCRTATTSGSVAHRFRRWVTSEVLPSIRRTGSYAVKAAPAPFAINVRDPAQISVIALQLLQVNQELVAENVEVKKELVVARAEVEEQRPMVDGFLAFLDDGGLCNLRTAARFCEAPSQLFIDWMKDKGYLIRENRDLQPAAAMRRDGYMKLRARPDANGKMRGQALVTRGGLNWLRQRWSVGPGKVIALQAAVAAKQGSLPGL